MKKSAFFASLAWIALCIPSWATSVNFADSTTARLVENPNLSNVPVGSLVMAGVFSSVGSFTYNPALSVATNYSNMQSQGGWVQFGYVPNNPSLAQNTQYTLSIKSVFGSGAYVGGIVEDDTSGATTGADYFNGKQLYVVIFNGTTVAASTAMGVFTSTQSADWPLFPTNAGGLNDTGYYDTEGTSSTSPAGGTAMSAVDNAGSVTGTTVVLSAASVPEPSTLASLFGATGCLALLRRRRSE